VTTPSRPRTSTTLPGLRVPKPDALGVLGDDLVLALHHPREVDGETGVADPVLGGVEPRELIVLGGAEEGLRGDAADVDAGAAEGLVEFDADDGEAELRGADGGDVAPRTAADDADVGGEGKVGHWSRVRVGAGI
jgi:hypothetical protein